MAASGSGEALNAGNPRTEPEEPVPDAEHDASLLPPTAGGAQPAGPAGATPLATPAHHVDASALREAPPRGPPGARAKSEARETTPDTPQRAADRETFPGGHNRDEDSFDAFMASCMSDSQADPAPTALRVSPERRRHHTEGTALTVLRQAHLQRDDSALEKIQHATAAHDAPATGSGAADQAPDKRGTPGSGTRVEEGTNTASKPTGDLRGTALCWGRGHLDYARSESDTRQPSDHAKKAAAQDLGLWIVRLTTKERLALVVRL